MVHHARKLLRSAVIRRHRFAASEKPMEMCISMFELLIPLRDILVVTPFSPVMVAC